MEHPLTLNLFVIGSMKAPEKHVIVLHLLEIFNT